MRLFDSHCHFEKADEETIRGILRRAKEAGVDRILVVGGSDALNESARLAVALAAEDHELYPLCELASGFDRDSMNCDFSTIPETLKAWGEIGLDYFYSPETRHEQCNHFSKNLEEAKRRDLPVIIHTRNADDDTLAILREIPSRGIIHCFTGDRPFCRRLLDLGFLVSISGIVTFRAADNVREVASFIPNDRLLIETDSPFLAPVPMRGKANEPSFLPHTLKYLAELKGIAPDILAEITYNNF